MQDWDIIELVEDNASPDNNDEIRSSHRRHGVNIVGYNATERQKEIIRTLIEEQTRQYRRPQDRKAQMTKQTRELGRLPAWTPNSPDLNLIEVVWSWMVKWMRQHDNGWPRDPDYYIKFTLRVIQLSLMHFRLQNCRSKCETHS